MATTIYSTIALIHVAAGFMGLLTFWLPVFAQKGGALHRKIGRTFARAMILAACTALLMSAWTLLQPLATHPDRSANDLTSLYLFNGAFLGYLGFLSLMTARNGLTVVARKREHEKHRNYLDITITVAVFATALLSLTLGIKFGEGALIGLSPVGLILAPFTLAYFFRTSFEDPKFYLYMHLGNMIGAGIATHTAFFAFGANQLIPNLFSSVWVWITPSIIGTTAITVMITKYRLAARKRS